MASRLLRNIIAKFVFFAGFFLMTLGISFLLGYLDGISKIVIFLSFICIFSGAFFAVLAIRLNIRVIYLFVASFLIMAGFFLFLSALGIIPLPFSKAWPMLSVFSGLALLPSGWKKYGAFHISFIVPSCALIALGCVLLIFSLNIVPFSFKHFILTWWPLLVLLAGLILVLASLGTKNNREPRE